MLIVHIGRGRVGSTSLQNCLLQNRGMLRDHGVDFPEAAEPYRGNHVPLALGLTGRHPEHAAAARAFCERVKRRPDRMTIVSSEFLFGLPPEGVAALAAAAEGQDVLIVYYVRPYWEWFRSLYFQACAYGKNTAGFDHYYAVQRDRCLSLDKLEPWADAFGWNRVRIRALDPRCLDGGDLISDFSSVLGVDLPRPGAFNTSPHWLATEFVRALYATAQALDLALPAPAVRPFADLFVAQLVDAEIADAEYLTLEQEAWFLDAYERDLLTFAERTGSQLPRPVQRRRPERPFEPSLRKVPSELWAHYNEAAAAASFRAHHNPAVQTVLDRLSDEIIRGAGERTAGPASR